MFQVLLVKHFPMRSKDLSCFPSIFHFVPCATLNQVLSCTITTMQRGATSMVLNLCTSCQLFAPLIFVYRSFSNNNIVWTVKNLKVNQLINTGFISDRTLPHFTWAMICVRRQTSDFTNQTTAPMHGSKHIHIYKFSTGGLLCMKIYMYVNTGYIQRYVHGGTLNSTNPASTTTTHKNGEYYHWVCEGHADLYII